MIALGWFASCVFVTAGDEDRRPDRADDLWVMVEDEAGHPIPDAVGVVAGGPTARTNAAGEMVFPDLGGGITHDLVVHAEGARFTTGHVRVDPDETSVVTVSLGQRSTHRPRYPEEGAAFGVDGVYALVLPPSDEALTVDWRWVAPGEPLGPSKHDADGAPLDLVALLELVDAELPLTLRVDAVDPRDLQLYRFDPAEGSWVSEGDAGRSGAYVVVTLPSTGWWAVGVPSEGRALQGRMYGPALHFPRAEVRTRVADRPGVWRQGASPDGRFTLPVPEHSVFTTTARTASASVRYSGAVQDQTSLPLVGWSDRDGDGHAADPSWGGDCDDGNPAIRPGVPDDGSDGVDWNCDGVPGIDADRDTFVEDCDDNDRAVHPGAPEVCDDRDNDCDDALSERDEGDPKLFVATRDNDCAPCDPTAVTRLEPKLYWRLASTGIGHDSSGFGHDGTVSGLDELWPGITHWGDPDQLGELTPRFPGVSGNHVVIDDFDGFGTEAFSVSMWVRPHGFGLGRTLMSYAIPGGPTPDCDDPAADGSHELTLEFFGTDLRVWIGGRRADSTELDVLPWKWGHIVLTWSPEGGVRVYLNDTAGVRLLAFSDPSTGDVSGGPTDGLVPGGRLVLGQGQRCADGSDCIDRWSAYTGMIDEVAIFDRALRDSEIEALFESATCGEYPCTGSDEDDDGRSDEHIRGAFPLCPADSCEQVWNRGSFVGDGLYWLDYLFEGEYQRGTCSIEDGELVESVCGNGIVDRVSLPPRPRGWPGAESESCDDPGAASCFQCTLDTLDLVGVRARDCRELGDILTHNGLEAHDGPYWIADPLSPDTALPVRCVLDEEVQGGGWTLVFFHQSDSGVVFIHDEDADLLSDDLETGCPAASSPGLPDTDLDGVPDGQEVLFDGTDPCDPEDVHEIRTAGKPVAYPAHRANTSDPFSTAYSILDRLEGFRGPEGFEFRMTWPCTSEDPEPRHQIWRQRHNPNDPGDAPTGARCSREQKASALGCYPGLRRRPDEVPRRAWISRWPDDNSWAYPAQDPIGVYEPGLAVCEDHLLPANGKYIPTDGIGVGCDATNNQTVPSVELWVRPW